MGKPTDYTVPLNTPESSPDLASLQVTDPFIQLSEDTLSNTSSLSPPRPLLFRAPSSHASITLASEVARCAICDQYLSLHGIFRFRGTVRECVLHPNRYYCGLCCFSDTECMLCFRRIETRDHLMEWVKQVNWGSYIPSRFDYFMCLLQEYGVCGMLPPLWTVTLSTRYRTFQSQFRRLIEVLGPLATFACYCETDAWNVLRRIYSSYECAMDLGTLYRKACEYSERERDLRYQLFAQDYYHIALTLFDYNVKDDVFDAPYTISQPLLISFPPGSLTRLEGDNHWLEE